MRGPAIPVLNLGLSLGIWLGTATAVHAGSSLEACISQARAAGTSAAETGGACNTLLAPYRESLGREAPLVRMLENAGAEALADWAMTLPGEQRSAQAALDPAAVDAILAQTLQPERPKSLWQRLQDWINALLFPQNQPPPQPEWMKRLAQWLHAIPESTVRTSFWTLFGLLAAGLLAILVQELRAAGVLARSALAPWSDDASAPYAAPAHAGLTLETIDRLPRARQPAALLRWVLERYAARGWLPADSALTNQELLARLRAQSTAEFTQLVRGVERVVYGGRPLADDELGALRGLAGSLAGGA